MVERPQTAFLLGAGLGLAVGIGVAYAIGAAHLAQERRAREEWDDSLHPAVRAGIDEALSGPES